MIKYGKYTQRKDIQEQTIAAVFRDLAQGKPMTQTAKRLYVSEWMVKQILLHRDEYPFVPKDLRDTAWRMHQDRSMASKKAAAPEADDTSPEAYDKTLLDEIADFIATASDYIDAAYRLRLITGSSALADYLFEGILAKQNRG